MNIADRIKQIEGQMASLEKDFQKPIVVEGPFNKEKLEELHKKMDNFSDKLINNIFGRKQG
jgi:hypothetical protein